MTAARVRRAASTVVAAGTPVAAIVPALFWAGGPSSFPVAQAIYVVVAVAAALVGAVVTMAFGILRLHRTLKRDRADLAIRAAIEEELASRLPALSDRTLVVLWRDSLGAGSVGTHVPDAGLQDPVAS